MKKRPKNLSRSLAVHGFLLIAIAAVALSWRLFSGDQEASADTVGESTDVVESAATAIISGPKQEAEEPFLQLDDSDTFVEVLVPPDSVELVEPPRIDVVEMPLALQEPIAPLVVELPESPDTHPAEPAVVGNPVRLVIPRIALVASIESVGVTPEGAMAVPTHPLDAGWYMHGPRPGEAGSAVIAGHVDWYYDAEAVFADLGLLEPGDTITVKDANATDRTFVVREIRTYAAAQDATDIFASQDGGVHLNLITCVGEWDTDAGQYTDRLVVFADLHTQ